MGPWIVYYILCCIPSMSISLRWRLILGLGAIPASLVLILTYLEARWFPENPQLSRQQKSTRNQTNQDSTSPYIIEDSSLSALLTEDSSQENYEEGSVGLWKALGDREVVRGLIAAGGGWFLYDICYCKSLSLSVCYDYQQ